MVSALWGNSSSVLGVLGVVNPLEECISPRNEPFNFILLLGSVLLAAPDPIADPIVDESGFGLALTFTRNLSQSLESFSRTRLPRVNAPRLLSPFMLSLFSLWLASLPPTKGLNP